MVDMIELHAKAMRQFDKIYSATYNERKQCREDRRFYSIAGAQWEGWLGDQFENKPKFELNKVHLALIRIFSEYRNNRIDVDFKPRSGAPQNDKLSDACDGLYRADEQDSSAKEAMDNAFEEAVGGGFGAWRLRACYEDEEEEDAEYQRIKWEPITDADACVYFDQNAKRKDKSDAGHCFVLIPMTRDAYREAYNEDPIDWPKRVTSTGITFDWYTNDIVYVGEYYVIEEVAETIRSYIGISGDELKFKDSYLKENPDKADELKATGYKYERSRKIKSRKCHKYILNGLRVLDDEGYIAGKNIPIIPAYGKRWYYDGIERYMGHVRLAKDAQRLKNMQLSKLAEISAQSSVEKPIFTPEQVAGNEDLWRDDNIKNYPYLLVNPMTNPITGETLVSGPIGYTKSASVPPVLAALLQFLEQDLQDLLGKQEAAEEMKSGTSGDVVELIQQRLDMQVFIYMDNMADAIRRCGEIWLDMAKDLYVEKGRKMKAIASDGSESEVEILRQMWDEKRGSYEENDLTKAKFGVFVDVGPSSTTKRAATARSLVAMSQTTDDPETKQVLTHAALLNMEGEGLSDFREWSRKKLVGMGVLQPNEEEKQAMQEAAQNKQPSAQDQYLQSAAEEASARATKARADTVLTVAKSEQTKAETAQTLSQLSLDHQDQAVQHAIQLHEAINGKPQTTHAPR